VCRRARTEEVMGRVYRRELIRLRQASESAAKKMWLGSLDPLNDYKAA
jgi:hypothetical protein